LSWRSDAEAFRRYYGVTSAGNFEGKNILHVQPEAAPVGARTGADEQTTAGTIARGRRILLETRTQRASPGLDDKVLAAWNGLMLAAFAEAGQVLARSDYLEVAARNAEFLLLELSRDGRLMRSWTPAAGGRHNAYLEDYACVADGLLALYRSTFDMRWLVEARTLADSVLAHFSDPLAVSLTPATTMSDWSYDPNRFRITRFRPAMR